MSHWTTENMPDLTGKVAIITGANGGLGIETAKALATKGCEVVMACRDQTKGMAAIQHIQETLSSAKLYLMVLDLADLSSIRNFAKQFCKQFQQLDLLILNAGLIGLPLCRSKDGFEMQMGVDCLGHFALTGLLFNQLKQSKAARIVTVGTSSQPHSFGKINLADLNWHHRRYRSLTATLQAKLAFQVIGFELARRLTQQGIQQISSIVVHPGIATTNISLAGAKMRNSEIRKTIANTLNTFIAQPAYFGALPSLYAATASQAKNGDYFGPDGWFEIRGYPTALKAGKIMHDRKLAMQLWQQAEQLTGVSFL